MLPMRNPTPEEYVEIVRALESMRPPLPLSPSDMIRWARRAKILEVAPYEVIMTQGSMPDCLYLLLSGQLRAVGNPDNRPQVLNYHNAPAFVGEYGVLHRAPRTASVEAVSEAKLACWSLEDATRLLNANGAIRAYLKRGYALYVKWAKQQFPGKQWDETVVFRSRKHGIQLLLALMRPFVLFSAGVFTGLILGTWFYIAAGIAILAGLAWGAYCYLDWANDEYIVTSKRVIHIERMLLRGEKRDEAPLVRIQDITVVSANLFQRLLDYSDVRIQTAGAGTIIFSGMPHANRVRDLIFSERAREQERRTVEDRIVIRSALQQGIQKALSTKELNLSSRPMLPPRTGPEKNDKIVWRKHPIVLFFKILPPLLFLNGSIAALLVFTVVNPQYLIMAVLFATVSFVWFLFELDDWSRDVYIIEGDRIIDVVSSGFRVWGERRREGTFDAVQNVTYVVPSFWHGLVKMGNVVIETAGTEQTFAFNSVFNPSKVQQEVFDRWSAHNERRRRREQEEQRRRWAEWFSEYHLLQSRME